MSEVILIKRGCRICGSDIVGNDEILYYCKECKVYFNKKDIKEGLFRKFI